MTYNLCIPRVFNTLNESQIRSTFEQLNFGKIDKVVIVRKKNEKFNIAFVYYKKWYDNDNAQRAIRRLENNQDIKIVYDTPWFWKVTKTIPSTFEKWSQSPLVEKWSKTLTKVEKFFMLFSLCCALTVAAL
jgi:hypothetical protein